MQTGEPQASPKRQEKSAFIKFQEEIGEGCFEQEFIDGKGEFKAVAVSFWLWAEGSCYCWGKQGRNLPSSCWLCKLQQMVVHENLPSWLPNFILNGVSFIRFMRLKLTLDRFPVSWKGLENGMRGQLVVWDHIISTFITPVWQLMSQKKYFVNNTEENVQ